MSREKKPIAWSSGYTKAGHVDGAENMAQPFESTAQAVPP
jgi:hypothetical protein